VLAKVREMVLPAIEKDGPVKAWIVTRGVDKLDRAAA
jgi:hypothetical protein